MFELIDKALKEKGITYCQFAEAIGVSVSAIYEWKKGNYKPKLDKLIAISKFLDISLDELVKGAG